VDELGAQPNIDARIQAYYGSEFDEGDRLVTRSGAGILEFERTQSIVRRLLAPGSRIIDIGGGTGVHAAALAADGHRVTLVDPVPVHVQRAQAYATFEARLGDVRDLDEPPDSYDAALLLGPLYHLEARAERLRALRVAMRVVRPGGWVVAAAISRLATTCWAAFVEPMLAANPVDRMPLPAPWRRLIESGRGGMTGSGFPGGHFHLSDELEGELADAGLHDVTVRGLEGPAGQVLDISRETDPHLLGAARVLADRFESQPGLRDFSPHLLGVGRVPSGIASN
jgi:SAM-dependent methyltransferase